MATRGEEGECGGCGKQQRWPLLHNVRHRAAYKRMCTNCILSTHPGLFCPYCFVLHEHQPPSNISDLLTCMKCATLAHSSCVPNSSSSNFVCPSCSSSSFLYFNPARATALDKNSARALVSAAQIAAISMAKAASLARLEAERRVKDAALAKKRARDALEKLCSLSPSSNTPRLPSSLANGKRIRSDSFLRNGDADSILT